MSLRAPNLDNRSFDQMVEESKNRIRELCPQWTDTSPSDPGIILLELFAYLNEAMIYRLNRLPEKAYVEFLRLIGVTVSAPSAAVVNLKFSVPKAASGRDRNTARNKSHHQPFGRRTGTACLYHLENCRDTKK